MKLNSLATNNTLLGPIGYKVMETRCCFIKRRLSCLEQSEGAFLGDDQPLLKEDHRVETGDEGGPALGLGTCARTHTHTLSPDQ